MPIARSITLTLLLSAAIAACAGSDGGDSSTPAPCEVDADCPDDVQCLHLHDDATGAEGPGFCDVSEHDSDGTSSGVPAPCEVDTDCGEGGVCLHIHDDETGEDVLGYCLLDESDCPRYCEGGEEEEAIVCQDDDDCESGTCSPPSVCQF